MEDKDFTIENHLRQLRKMQQLSQEELAEHLGISRQSIIALEQGHTMPSLPLAVSICQFFNTAFEDVFEFEREMDRLLEDSAITPAEITSGMPKVDIKDTKDVVVVKAELPGINEEDINIEILDNVMTISGEKKEEKEEEEKGYYYKESHSGTFSRSFTLPADVKAEKAIAEMKNGVLTIQVPKIGPKKASKVKIAKK